MILIIVIVILTSHNRIYHDNGDLRPSTLIFDFPNVKQISEFIHTGPTDR